MVLRLEAARLDAAASGTHPNTHGRSRRTPLAQLIITFIRILNLQCSTCTPAGCPVLAPLGGKALHPQPLVHPLRLPQTTTVNTKGRRSSDPPPQTSSDSAPTRLRLVVLSLIVFLVFTSTEIRSERRKIHVVFREGAPSTPPSAPGSASSVSLVATSFRPIVASSISSTSNRAAEYPAHPAICSLSMTDSWMASPKLLDQFAQL